MNKIFFILLACLILESCEKKPIITPVEIDFTSSNYYTPAEINKYSLMVDCDKTAYWDNKRVKLQGFLFSGNINTADKKFFVYEKNNVGDPSNQSIIVYYQSKDSAAISKTIFDNRDKHCLIKATCFTGEAIINKCAKFVLFTITNPADLEFK